MSFEHPEKAPEDEPSTDPCDAHITMDRRVFLALLCAAGLAGGTAIAAKNVGENERIPTNREMAMRLAKKAAESKASLAYTVGEAAVFSAAQTAVGGALTAVGVQHGGHAYSQSHSVEAAEKNQFMDYCLKCGLIPLIEEALFRLVPAAMTADNDMAWGTGLAANVAFSAVHNFDKDENGDYMIFYKTVPALQFILGAYCWHLQKTRGFSHAAAAHMTYNCLMGILPTFFEKDPPTDSDAPAQTKNSAPEPSDNP